MCECGLHGCVGTWMWRPEADVTDVRGQTDVLGVEFFSYHQTNHWVQVTNCQFPGRNWNDPRGWSLGCGKQGTAAGVGRRKHQTRRRREEFPHAQDPTPASGRASGGVGRQSCPKRGGHAGRPANRLLLWLSFLTAPFLGTRKPLQNCLCQLCLSVWRDSTLRCSLWQCVKQGQPHSHSY